MTILSKTLLALAVLVAGSHSLRANVVGALTFPFPTGVVGPTDPIPLDLLLTLSAGSDPLLTDAAAHVIGGYTLADVNAHLSPVLPAGVDTATDTLFGVVSVGIGCPGGPIIDTFVAVNNCVLGPPYTFQFELSPANIGNLPNLDIEPSTPTQFLFGTFVPSSGPVADGTYTMNAVAVGITIMDATVLTNGHPSPIANVPIALSLNSDAGDFTRTVVSAPEPGSFLLFGAGLAVLSLLVSRRKPSLT